MGRLPADWWTTSGAPNSNVVVWCVKFIWFPSPFARTFRVQTKADRSAAELAQALRRERAAQGNTGNAQAEVEELKEELGRMMEAFARSGRVVHYYCYYCRLLFLLQYGHAP